MSTTNTSSSPSGRALATPAIQVKQDKPEEATTPAPVVEVQTPAAPTPAPATPKPVVESDTLTDGDNSYIATIILASFSSALSFGGVASTEILKAEYKLAGSAYMIGQTAVAFAYLYLIFSFLNTFTLIQTLNQDGDKKKAQIKKSMMLKAFNIILVIIAEACFGSQFSWVQGDSVAFNFISYVQACFIISIITNCVGIWISKRAGDFWAKSTNPIPVKPLTFEHPSISPLLNGTAIISSINLGFAVGAVLWLLGPATASANELSSTGWAFTLLYLLSALIANILSIITLTKNPNLPVKTAATVQWAFGLCSFAFALIASGFVITESFHTYIWQYNQGMIIGGWTISLATFIMGVTAATLIEGRNCCVECAAADKPATHDDLQAAKKQLEIEKLKLEAAKLARERSALEAV